MDQLAAKKLKLHQTYAAASPYPDFPHPTRQESKQVHQLLCPNGPLPKKNPDRKQNSAETCGATPNVLDSLVGTILSQNTSSRNSTAAKHALDAEFEIPNDDTQPEAYERAWERIVLAPHSKVMETLKHGGLASKKAATIQKLLKEVKEKHGSYSLQHLATSENQSDADIMAELLAYSGVGPKTASCVLLFCLSKPSFAVDTHVFRLSKMLGWVPASADRIKAQAHLDVVIPDELKYDLHVAFVRHGRTCNQCRANASPLKRGKRKVKKEEEGEEVEDTGCVLRRWIRERCVKKEELDE